MHIPGRRATSTSTQKAGTAEPLTPTHLVYNVYVVVGRVGPHPGLAECEEGEEKDASDNP
jgi:hypothetical protein